MSKQLLRVEGLQVTFKVRPPHASFWSRAQPLQAVSGVDFELAQGETLGIVGESGCGKSTLARAITRVVPASGKLLWMGEDNLLALDTQQMMPYRSQIQMVFQDPLASLDPRMTVGQIIAEPLQTHQPQLSRGEVKERVKTIMAKVSLLPNQINRYPHEFSGGQCQRIGIARALIVEPKLIICDEPVSALDVSIQAQVINLLMELQQSMGLSLLFIAHDLAVVKHISHRVMVLYLGKVMEIAERDQLYQNAAHPYTQALIAAVPIPDPVVERSKQYIVLEGELPSPLTPPSGCVFRTRCPRAQALCAEQEPPLQLLDKQTEHKIACHFPLL